MSSCIRKILFAVLLWVVTLPAIAENTILLMGDSLSAAYGMQQEQSWVFLLKERLRKTGLHYLVVNLSVSGATTSNGLAQLPSALKKYHPQVTIIALGGNDGLRGLPLRAIKRNLTEMVAAAKEANSKVLLVGVRLPPNYGPAYIQGFQKTFESVAKSKEVQLVPMMLKSVGENRSLFQEDGIHPTAQAQSIILGNIWPVLEPMLK